MKYPVMAKVVAIWLIENTSLTFQQIADFCGMHVLSIEALANQEGSHNHGLSPILTKELTEEEIKRCEADPNAKLQYKQPPMELEHSEKVNVSRFKKQNKPQAILWLVQNYPNLSDYQIAKLIGSTASVVKAIRNKTHWNYRNLTPKNPIALDFCEEHTIVKMLEHKAANKKD